MHLNEYGWIAYNEWNKLPGRFSNFELDVFQIMPNHIHGIIVLNDVGAGLAPAHFTDAHFTDAHFTDAHFTDSDNTDSDNTDADNTDADNDATGAGASPAPTETTTLGNIIGAYKSLVANECLKIFKLKNETMGKLWQHNYFEHIIRNEQSYQTISNYIVNNPANWNNDKFFEP